MIEERITWVAAMLDDEGRKELLEYAELLFVRQIAAETTEQGLGAFVPDGEPANDRDRPPVR